MIIKPDLFQTNRVRNIVDQGIDKSKLVIGIQTQAIKYWLLSTDNNTLYAPINITNGSRLTYPEVRWNFC